MLYALFCRVSCSFSCSRPKTIDDVSAQEHTVAVLRKTLTSTNVRALSLMELSFDSALVAPAHAFLRPTWNREDVHHSGAFPTALWVCATLLCTNSIDLIFFFFQSRQLPEPCTRVERVGRARHLHRTRQDQKLCAPDAPRASRRVGWERVPVSAVQNHHPRRSGLDDARRAGCAAAYHGDLRAYNALLSRLQLCYQVRLTDASKGPYFMKFSGSSSPSRRVVPNSDSPLSTRAPRRRVSRSSQMQSTSRSTSPSSTP